MPRNNATKILEALEFIQKFWAVKPRKRGARVFKCGGLSTHTHTHAKEAPPTADLQLALALVAAALGFV